MDPTPPPQREEKILSVNNRDGSGNQFEIILAGKNAAAPAGWGSPDFAGSNGKTVIAPTSNCLQSMTQAWGIDFGDLFPIWIGGCKRTHTQLNFRLPLIMKNEEPSTISPNEEIVNAEDNGNELQVTVFCDNESTVSLTTTLPGGGTKTERIIRETVWTTIGTASVQVEGPGPWVLHGSCVDSGPSRVGFASLVKVISDKNVPDETPVEGENTDDPDVIEDPIDGGPGESDDPTSGLAEDENPISGGAGESDDPTSGLAEDGTTEEKILCMTNYDGDKNKFEIIQTAHGQELPDGWDSLDFAGTNVDRTMPSTPDCTTTFADVWEGFGWLTFDWISNYAEAVPIWFGGCTSEQDLKTQLNFRLPLIMKNGIYIALIYNL
ncbi:MAG: hypothetical protein SGCHY_005479 [Lobulomycetales sp.]